MRSRTTEVKAHILCGIIWGLWHAPVIAMGHNYGTGYSGYPWLGILAMCLVCMSLGVFCSYVASKSGSIWPAALAHGAVNAVAGIPVLFLHKDIPLLNIAGPSLAGVITGIPFLLFSIALIVVSTRQIKSNG